MLRESFGVKGPEAEALTHTRITKRHTESRKQTETESPHHMSKALLMCQEERLAEKAKAEEEQRERERYSVAASCLLNPSTSGNDY